MDIYQYDDFRLFLKEMYHQKMIEEPKYSYRKFAAAAGFTNPGYLNDVIKGFKNLSANAAEQMGQAFDLKPHETEFLKLLAAYGQARTAEKKADCYRKVLARRNRSRFTRLNPTLTKYYQDYQYGLVRGAIEVLDFRGDYESLATFLDPPIAVATVKKLLRDLCEWGLVEQGPDGRYQTTPAVVEPSTNLMGMARQINGDWLIQAREALNRLPKDKRHVSTMVLNISEELGMEIDGMIEAFRDAVFKKVESDSRPRKIVQLTIAYIPKSRTRG
jgi:uncharacterized protein (TIGR02147 family)